MSEYQSEINRVLEHIGMSDYYSYNIGKRRTFSDIDIYDTKVLFCGVRQEIVGYEKKKPHWFFGEPCVEKYDLSFIFRIDTIKEDVENMFIRALERHNIYYYKKRAHLYVYTDYLHFNIPADQIKQIGKQLFEEIKKEREEKLKKKETDGMIQDKVKAENLRKIVEGVK